MVPLEGAQMHEVVGCKLPAIIDICRQHHVQRLELFGSALGDQFDVSRSDVDFLVTFGDVPEKQYGHNYFDLVSSLEALLGRTVDVIVAGNIRNPYIQRSIEATKETIYAA